MNGGFSMELREELSRLPGVGLGTWENDDHETCVRTVSRALEIGYRHVDTAQMYNNEAAVGEAVRASSVPREDVFLATKISFRNLTPEKVRQSTLESLDRLGVDRVDLLYVHWPAGEYEAPVTLPELDELKQEGLTRYIGVSNFPTHLVEEARDVLSYVPPVNQVEFHPYLQQATIRRQAADLGQTIVAYSPFRHGTIVDDPVLEDIAGETGSTPAQVVLAWMLQLDNVFPIPKATGDEHLKENFQATDVELSDRHVNQIQSLDRGDRYIDPPFAPRWDEGVD